MKTTIVDCFIVSLLLIAPVSYAQNVGDNRPVPEASAAVVPTTRYNLQLQWNEKRRETNLSYLNESSEPLGIEGVQSSGGLYITSFPKTIAPGQTGTIGVIYAPDLGSTSTAEIVRLRTSEGVKTLIVETGREAVASWDRTSLTWSVGEAATAKVAVITLRSGASVKHARAMRGASVSIEEAGGGSYRVIVTPANTANVVSFPVILTLDPEVPGVTPLLNCYIGRE